MERIGTQLNTVLARESREIARVAARNAAAHGPADDEKGSIWPRHNHLIFSAWLQPLIVKKLLAQAGPHAFTVEDKVARAGFEVFLAHDLLALTDKDENKVWWQIAESEL